MLAEPGFQATEFAHPQVGGTHAVHVPGARATLPPTARNRASASALMVCHRVKMMIDLKGQVFALVAAVLVICC